MVICSKQSFCHEATNTRKGEVAHCEPVTNRNCMLFILISSAHPELNRPQLVPEQNHNQGPEPRRLCHLHQRLSLIVLVESGGGGSTQENKRGRSGPTRPTVQGQPGPSYGASSPARLENGTLPSFVNPPSCCDVSRRSSVLTFLFQTTSEPCRCGHLQTKENTQGKQAGMYLPFTPKLTREYQCDRQHPLPFLLC